MSRFGNNSSPHPVVRPEPFAGREQLIAQFKAYALAGRDDPPPILCYFGIGGQGKHAPAPTAPVVQEEAIPACASTWIAPAVAQATATPARLQAIAAGLQMPDSGLLQALPAGAQSYRDPSHRATWEMAGGSGEWDCRWPNSP